MILDTVKLGFMGNNDNCNHGDSDGAIELSTANWHRQPLPYPMAAASAAGHQVSRYSLISLITVVLMPVT